MPLHQHRTPVHRQQGLKQPQPVQMPAVRHRQRKFLLLQPLAVAPNHPANLPIHTRQVKNTTGLALLRPLSHPPAMRPAIFLSGILVIGLGISALQMLEKQPAFGFFQGAITLGGGFLICGLFSLKMHWHGIIGAGVLGLLGTARGLGNIPDLFKLAAGDHSRGPAPLLELGVTLISCVILLRVLQALQRERTRRMLENQAD